jgi:iron(III) transport system substrate-binding protein
MEVLDMTRMKFAFLTGIVAVVILIGCSDDGEAPPKSGEVVVYSSVDEVFARPIAEDFEKETGIEVRLVPDTEETKSTGLLNRLIAEKQRAVAQLLMG